ncbi:MAG TPA: hypothetical protein VLG14_09490 [Sphingomonas sp.]|jgi:hypothetical protein|nr:hypothetical protein [Sphingomonas sp.]
MGFFTILRSIEEFLYEVMTWLVFFPRTLWQVIRHPAKMIDYSDHEQTDQPAEQYTDTISPPLFLMLTILLCHGLELTLHMNLDGAKTGLGKTFLNSEENLLIFRVIVSSIYPLVFATGLLKRSDRRVDRNTLRAPFFSQCYLAALFTLALSLNTLLVRSSDIRALIAAGVVLLLIVAWYVAVQTLWFAQHLKVGRGRAFGIAFGTFLKATLINSLVSAFFVA